MSINVQRILLVVALLVSLVLIASCGNQNGTATSPKIEHTQTIIFKTGPGLYDIAIQRSDEPPWDGDTGTPDASPISIPPK
ncbi:MAG: hypothetical protein Q7S53_03615 [bacterium]|nr:hypothetical protein [bacterium]